MFFLNDVTTFGYRQAITNTYKALANKKASGQTLGQIGSKFGRKMLNATRGKIAGIGRGFNRLRNELGSNPVARSTILSAKQQSRASRNYKKAGGLKSTATPGGTMNLGNDTRLKPSPMVSPSRPKPKTFGEFNP